MKAQIQSLQLTHSMFYKKNKCQKKVAPEKWKTVIRHPIRKLKILQCAIFGTILCFIYYKTRNLYVVAVLHSLDDFLLLIATGASLKYDQFKGGF